MWTNITADLWIEEIKYKIAIAYDPDSQEYIDEPVDYRCKAISFAGEEYSQKQTRAFVDMYGEKYFDEFMRDRVVEDLLNKKDLAEELNFDDLNFAGAA